MQARPEKKHKSGKYEVSNLEWMIIVGFFLFGVVWSLVIVPILTGNKWYLELNPPSQYIIYNIGSVVMLTGILGIPLDYFFEGEITIRGMISGGITSFTLFALLDLWQPPFAYGWNGNFLILNQEALSGTAVDSVLGWIWNGLGIHGHLLYIFIYVISPAIALTANAIFLKPDQLLKLIER
ncbi:MAG: hypothetical protein PHW62_00590 [Candidatus Ratteibacteria bacterium]|nr:hypothetical protein [Candidatus Ratteibacteria bacterium]